MNSEINAELGAKRELWIVCGVVALICFLAGRSLGLPWGAELAPTIVSLSFLFGALEMIRRDPRGSEAYGVALGGLLIPAASPGAPRPPLLQMMKAASKEIGYALFIALLTFPPFVLLYAHFTAPEGSFSFGAIALSPLFILSQFLIIALTEEVFFRGYLQTRLHDVFPKRRRVLGASLSLSALTIQSAYFALIHFIVIPHPSRLSVFFPALLFGYMRERRGGVGAAIVYHALSNLLAEALYQGYA